MLYFRGASYIMLLTDKTTIFLKEYIFSLGKFILVAFLVFVFSILAGYSSAQSSPEEMRIVLEQFREIFSPLVEMPPFSQFLAIFLNNSLTAFLVILLGIIFGFFPFLVLLSNGLALGIVIYFAQITVNWPTVFALTLPHGLIEIPVIILSCAVGFKLGGTFFERIFKGQGHIKTELNMALVFFLKFLFPLLAIAAAIETLIANRLLL